MAKAPWTMRDMKAQLWRRKLLVFTLCFLGVVVCLQILLSIRRSRELALPVSSLPAMLPEIPYSSLPNISEKKCADVVLTKAFEVSPSIPLRFCYTDSILEVDALYSNLRWFLELPERGVLEHMVALLQTYSAQNYVAVDLGLNVGFFSVASGLMGFTTHSFELQPLCLQKADQFLTLNEVSQYVHRYHIGIGDNTEQVIKVSDQVCGGTVGIWQQDLSSKVSVPMTTLDQVFWDAKARRSRVRIAVMKIDIEGAETEAIRGASNLLQHGYIENIIMEVNCHQANCLERQLAMFRSLRKYGFSPWQLYRWVENVDADKVYRANYKHPNNTDALPYSGLSLSVDHPLAWEGSTLGTSAWLIGDFSAWLSDLHASHGSANVWWH